MLTEVAQAFVRIVAGFEIRVVAASQGREDVIPDDVKSVLHPVLAHRIALTPDAELRDDTIDKVIERITSRVKPPLGVVQAA